MDSERIPRSLRETIIEKGRALLRAREEGNSFLSNPHQTDNGGEVRGRPTPQSGSRSARLRRWLEDRLVRFRS